MVRKVDFKEFVKKPEAPESVELGSERQLDEMRSATNQDAINLVDEADPAEIRYLD